MHWRSMLMAVVAAAAVLTLVPAGQASADPGGTLQATIDDAHGFPLDGACLQVIVPDRKNTIDQVIVTTAGSGTDGTPGHITQAGVPAGIWIGKYVDCGSATPFAAFYTGGTRIKSRAQTFSITDGALTNLGTQLVPPGEVGSVDGIVIDSHTGLGAPSVPVSEYTAVGDVLVDSTCTDVSGHYIDFNLPTGGVRIHFGTGLGCDNLNNFVPTWLGGTTFSTATTVTVVANDNVTAPDGTVTPVTSGHVTITSVTFSGSSAAPIITITGTGFKTAPSPDPADRPCGEADDPATGYDYGSNLIFWNTGPSGWQAGFPGDCIGLVIQSYSAKRIVLVLGSFYSDPQYAPLTDGVSYTMKVRGTAFTGTVTGLP